MGFFFSSHLQLPPFSGLMTGMLQTTLTQERITEYRQKTFRLNRKRLGSKDEAVRFVDERGFIFFWPIKEITLPSLWTAVAGNRPVADAHDDPGHITWNWKDSLLGKRRWYYAKVLRKRATIISLDLLPYFYALSNNYGSPEDDYLTLYEQGKLTQEAKLVYEALLKEGPLDTIALRKATRMTSRESDSRFNKALVDLQGDFKILPTGVSQAGRWRYAFFYEITPHHYPDLIDRTRWISDHQARCRVAEVYFRSVGAAQIRDLCLLFGWTPGECGRVLDELAGKGVVTGNLQIPGWQGEWWALKELVS
jgi:hypothetical protein